MQLNLTAPLFIILYYKKPKLGIFVTCLTIILGLFLSIAPQVLYGIKPYVKHLEVETFSELFESWKWYHLTPNGYITSYFVGILIGFILRKELSINRKLVIRLWIITIVAILSVYLWNNKLWRLDEAASDMNVLLWISTGKLILVFGFAWIYYALCTERAGKSRVMYRH